MNHSPRRLRPLRPQCTFFSPGVSFMHPTARSAFLASSSSRRGNTLVLVTAILVLLVIIATAFITRTQDGRKLATVQGLCLIHI